MKVCRQGPLPCSAAELPQTPGQADLAIGRSLLVLINDALTFMCGSKQVHVVRAYRAT